MIRRMKKPKPIPVVEEKDRVEPRCPHAGVCGGCLWQHIAYPAQVAAKKEMINKAFEAAGHEERISDVIPSPEQFYYRNRMDYVVGWRGEVGLKVLDLLPTTHLDMVITALQLMDLHPGLAGNMVRLLTLMAQMMQLTSMNQPLLILGKLANLTLL
jgi:tRNA/tmRNA/rRNA uracil-C5-methylase (TrmA/RlmC/RlmD family)